MIDHTFAADRATIRQLQIFETAGTLCSPRLEGDIRRVQSDVQHSRLAAVRAARHGDRAKPIGTPLLDNQDAQAQGSWKSSHGSASRTLIIGISLSRMRLLETTDGRKYTLTKEFHYNDKVPPYAILSHTWDTDQEVTFEDITEDNKSKYSRLRASLRARTRFGKKGYKKLRFCAQQAKRDGLRYFWVDTCCIDKKNTAELQTAINSMYHWYRDAAKCYVYLADVSTADRDGKPESPSWQPAFMQSRWFTRGWTLQEMLAPSEVEFFSQEGMYLGDRTVLKSLIHDVTDIPLTALSGTPLGEFSVDERLSWAAERETTREEDEVYSLLGIFDITLPFIYDEGYDKALRRLLGAIADSQVIPGKEGSPKSRRLRSTLPFLRDEDFISREVLDTVDHLCTRSAGRAVLVGLGGVGLREGYLEIAKKINLDGWNDPNVNFMQLVDTWLRNDANGSWLWVLDSADNPDVFSDAHFTPPHTAAKARSTSLEPQLPACLPITTKGSILITSRNRELACLLTGLEGNVVEVGPMDDQDAYALLQKKPSCTINKDEAIMLIKALDYLPLALTQALAFINRTPRMSISKYLKEIEHDRACLLGRNLVDIRRDAGAPSSLMTTWQISFDYIRERSPTAARLLSLMSLFDRQRIPKSLLVDKYTGQEHGNSDFRHDIYMLSSFCLVKTSANEDTFEMHGLVQLSTLKWLEYNEELEYWKRVYLVIINESFLDTKPGNWSVCQPLFPHVQAALDNHPKGADSSEPLEVWATLSYKASWYIGAIGYHNKAYQLAADSLDVREILLHPEDLDLLDSFHNVGVMLSRLGRYKEAEKMYNKAAEVQERVLGGSHTDTLFSKLNLAILYDKQGHWVKAESLLQKIIKLSSSLDSNVGRSLRLSMLGQLVVTHSNFGRNEEALALSARIIEAREKELGSNHRMTLVAKDNLAHEYRKQDRFDEAELLELEVLRIRKLDGHTQTEILSSKGSLATTYNGQGRWKEAEELLQEVLSQTQATYGTNHEHTIIAMTNVARSYWAQGRFSESETLELQIIDLRKALFGENHPLTLKTKAKLVDTYHKLGRHKESESLISEVIAVYESTLGPEHLLTLESRDSLATAYLEQGRYKEAEQLEEFIWRARQRILGEEHLDTLGNMGNLAVTYHRQGHVEKVFELMEKCYQANIKVLGEEHERTGRYKAGLAKWRKLAENTEVS
ncbi:hypothetical protein OPT61_g3150 [Boeremia exigua]|uniref:Uncharacterized protein n=1 Tax=Boeremia exigua TaxID=749465 RepID=A0ACC2IIU7_9PLEO|nr:hypothetical protein OPT61_g3150 [Boeremia exigua]